MDTPRLQPDANAIGHSSLPGVWAEQQLGATSARALFKIVLIVATPKYREANIENIYIHIFESIFHTSIVIVFHITLAIMARNSKLCNIMSDLANLNTYLYRLYSAQAIYAGVPRTVRQIPGPVNAIKHPHSLERRFKVLFRGFEACKSVVTRLNLVLFLNHHDQVRTKE